MIRSAPHQHQESPQGRTLCERCSLPLRGQSAPSLTGALPCCMRRRVAMKAVRVHKPGAPEGLVYEDVPDPQAGPGQVVVKVEAIGLNFAEVNRRRHADPASLPMPIGGEAAGTVAQV